MEPKTIGRQSERDGRGLFAGTAKSEREAKSDWRTHCIGAHMCLFLFPCARVVMQPADLIDRTWFC
jgi:hypothetical protein